MKAFLLAALILGISGSAVSQSWTATYQVLNRCPSDYGQFSNSSASGPGECALSCLITGDCNAFATGSDLSSCALGNAGQALSQWPETAAGAASCTSQLRLELRNPKIAGFWDFRRSLAVLLPGGSYNGSFQLQGGCQVNSTDGLVMSALSGQYATLSGISGTPFEQWENFSSINASLFMRVRRSVNFRSNALLSLHNCTDKRRGKMYFWESPENRLGLVQLPNPSGGFKYTRWLDDTPMDPGATEWVTLGFVHTVTDPNITQVSLWRSNQRSVEVTPNITLQPINVPYPPYCVSVGLAHTVAPTPAAMNFTGSIRCMLVANSDVDMDLVNAAFLGC